MSVKDYLLRNKRKIIRNCIFLSLMLVASLAGYLMALNTDSIVHEEAAQESLPAAANEQRTEEACVIAWEFLYETCGHTVKAESKINSDMTGLTLKEFEAKFKNIKVLDFSPKALTLQKSIKQYCPDHLILKAYDGVLGVFKTNLGSDQMSLSMRLAIPYEEVPDDLKTALYYGAVFNSMEEVEQYIAKKIEQ